MWLAKNASRGWNKHRDIFYTMKKSRYSKYQSYDMRTFFQTQPGVLDVCIKCNNKLSRIEIDRNTKAANKWHSFQPSIPLYELSFFYCNKCQWWYFRELLADCEIFSTQEYITIGDKSFTEAEKVESITEPWLHAFSDKSLHKNVQTLPKNIGEKFPLA